eukprot:2445568-Prymnesium_polylepis.1
MEFHNGGTPHSTQQIERDGHSHGGYVLLSAVNTVIYRSAVCRSVARGSGDRTLLTSRATWAGVPVRARSAESRSEAGA